MIAPGSRTACVALGALTPSITSSSSPWANSKIATSFSKSSEPRFDCLDGSRVIKEKVSGG